MPRSQQINISEGTGRYSVTNYLDGQLDLFLEETKDGVARLLQDEVDKQLDELRAAWPKPPDKVVTTYVPPEEYVRFGELVRSKGYTKKKTLKRTGKSGRAFYRNRYIRDTELVFTIDNKHKNRRGEAYVWMVKTKDFDMDGRKGKMTRAWHHFRRRAARIVTKAMVDKISNHIPKEL